LPLNLGDGVQPRLSKARYPSWLTSSSRNRRQGFS
jgi:hypothetical protein